MVWEPFALAVVFGLVVSAGLYFIVMWPQVEPDDDEVVADEGRSPAAPGDAPAHSAVAEPAPAAPGTDASSAPGTED